MAWLVNLAASKILVEEGEQSLSMYLLQEGQLIVMKNNVILGYINPGEIVGELSFLDNKPRSATVKALKDCKLVQIPKDAFDEVFESQPKWMDALIKSLAGRLREADARVII